MYPYVVPASTEGNSALNVLTLSRQLGGDTHAPILCFCGPTNKAFDMKRL